MVQAGNSPRFALKTLAKFRVCRQCGGQHFDGDRSVQARVAGFVDFTHAARAERLKDLVGTEFGSVIHDEYWHRCRSLPACGQGQDRFCNYTAVTAPFVLGLDPLKFRSCQTDVKYALLSFAGTRNHTFKRPKRDPAST